MKANGSKVFLAIFLLIASLFINYSLAQTTVPLQPGIPQDGLATVGAYVYYTYAPTTLLPGQKMVFIVTPFSGDADVYISQTPNPTINSNTWNATVANGDMVRIYQEDPRYNPTGTFYVGVYGYTTSQFSIMGYVSGGTITLSDGVPQVAYASSGNYVYFIYSLPEAHNFTISVTALYGDPDVFVSTTNPHPTTGNYTWSARSFGFDLLNINTNDPNFVSNRNYYIGVQSFVTSQYSITVTQQQTNAVLMETLPTIRSVSQGNYVFFKFYLSAAHVGLTVTATALSSQGDPDLYISKTNTQPTQSSYTWQAFSPGEDSITIFSNDPNGGVGWYYIGAYGFRESVFQIVASTDLDTVTLVDGIPQESQGAAGLYNYFKFYNGDPDVALSITGSIRSTGRIRLVISNSNPTPTNSPGKYDRISDSIQGSGFVQYQAPSPTGWFYIGVQHLTVGGLINYTVTAETNQSVTLLLANELNFFNYVPAGSYRYFVFDNQSPGQELSFTVGPWVGDPDLFVSINNPRPSMTNFTWRSNRAGADSVVVLTTDPHYVQGLYFISVYGFVESYFSIAAYLSGSNFPLQNGVPTPGAVAQSQYTYYTFTLTYTADVTIQLRVDVDSPDTNPGDDPDIFVSTSVTKPNQYHYSWRSINFGDDSIAISQALPGKYYIGVLGITNSTFTITASSGSTYLVDGYQLIDYVQEGSYRYYTFFVPNTTQSLLASVTLINGNTALVLSNNITQSSTPTIGSNTAMIQSFPGNALLLQQGDTTLITGFQYVIGVYGVVNSDYFVSVQTVSANILAGVPLLATAPFNGFVRFRYFVLTDMYTNTILQHTISVRVLHGAPSIFASQNTQNPETNPTWTYTGRSDGVIVIPGSELQSGFIYISVQGNQTINDAFYPNFEITVIPINEPTYLVQDQTITQEIAVGDFIQYSYFTIYTLNEIQNLFILVESCSNEIAPNFFIAKNISNPTSQNHTFASTRNEQRYSFASTLYMTADMGIIYNVGVLSETPLSTSKYSIFATTRMTQHPQPQNDGKLEISGDKDLTVKLSGATVNGYPAIYRVYLAKIYDGYNPEDAISKGEGLVNMYTTCGVVNNGVEFGFYAANELGENGDIEITFTVPDDSEYIVNVVVTDGFGLQSAYVPDFIRYGRGYNPGHPGWFGLSFGIIVFILVPVVIVLYLGIGVTVKAVKGARGIELIPNVEFWRASPGLVWAGIVFAFTFGGKIGGGYKKLETDTTVNSAEYTGNTVSSSNASADKNAGSYGAI